MESSASAVTAKVNPGVLKWVMENEGWDVDELAGEAGLDASRIRRWLSTESDISLADLEKMFAKFKRALPALFVPEVPKVTIPPHYRRSGGGGRAGRRMSRPMLDVIRGARLLQDNAAELLLEMKRPVEPDVPSATLRQSPELAAAKNLEVLGLEPPRRTGGGEARDRARYGNVRKKIEARNIFTMQASIPADEESSGFALTDPLPAVVLVNSRDPLRRRIFTLLHEYAHVLLSLDGVCPPAPAPAGGAAGDLPRVEQWCNRFAGAALMPKAGFHDALEDVRKEHGDGEPLRVVADLADRFCVSKTAALVRITEMLDGSAHRSKYARCYGLLKAAAVAPGGPDASRNTGGGPSQAVLCMARKGRRYARLVSSAGESGIITTSRMLEYLEIKLDHLNELRIKSGMD